ncbi:hypothetical protein RB195_013804 [Necator americanus]|uniref:Uncharacterized protein n=1 Tax=Necator americanus TaxID=51031 RepID=A0ABR1E016_NECAM
MELMTRTLKKLKTIPPDMNYTDFYSQYLDNITCFPNEYRKPGYKSSSDGSEVLLQLIVTLRLHYVITNQFSGFDYCRIVNDLTHLHLTAIRTSQNRINDSDQVLLLPSFSTHKFRQQ